MINRISLTSHAIFFRAYKSDLRHMQSHTLRPSPFPFLKNKPKRLLHKAFQDAMRFYIAPKILSAHNAFLYVSINAAAKLNQHVWYIWDLTLKNISCLQFPKANFPNPQGAPEKIKNFHFHSQSLAPAYCPGEKTKTQPILKKRITLKFSIEKNRDSWNSLRRTF